jgi:patatin-like phospholipase/acyl hydrolase
LATQSFQSKYPFRILALDGGGSKGVYTLGVLREVEAHLGVPLAHHFDLMYGTSTGAIIASMLALGLSVEAVQKEYFKIIPAVMKHSRKTDRSSALREHAKELFGDKKFDSFLIDVGLVATNCELERPFIFKRSAHQAFGRAATFAPGFGCTISDAVLASSAAYPLFERVTVETENHGTQTLMDGGFVANNPTLFAIADALKHPHANAENVGVLSVGVGHYKEPQKSLYHRILFSLPTVKLVQAQLATSTNTIEILRQLFFPHIKCARIDDGNTDAKYETDMLEANTEKLEKIMRLGSESFGKHESQIKQVLS